MNERLVFSYGTARHGGEAPAGGDSGQPSREAAAPAASRRAVRRPRDWAYIGLMAFTAVLFFRPQDTIPPLSVLHLAELFAIGALGALVADRLGRGQPVTRVTPELIGVVALGMLMLATAPFSVWPGGAVGTFTDIYMKVILIFVLMLNTLRTPRRVEQFTWLIVLATGYVAFRAMFDYARGVNLIENGRVQGALGGMFRNPNDLALNMVAVVPLALSLALRRRPGFGRLVALGCGLMMVGAIVVSHSRGGALGLGLMLVVLAASLVRARPGLVGAGAVIGVLLVPLAPDSYWQRLASITNEELDETGSREARSTLMREAWATFLAHPLTGIGAGQFKNYKPEEREAAWRDTHNAVLQVAAELGVVGLMIFGFLLFRGFHAPMQARMLLRRSRTRRKRGPPKGNDSLLGLTEDERTSLEAHTGMITAALAGWFVCALFASVAYYWTLYYLLALAIAPLEMLRERVASARASRRAAGGPAVAFGVHA